MLFGRRAWAVHEAEQIAEKLGFLPPNIVLDETSAETASSAITIEMGPRTDPDARRVVDRPILRIPWRCLDRLSDAQVRYRLAIILLQYDPSRKRAQRRRESAALALAIASPVALLCVVASTDLPRKVAVLIWGAATLASVLFLIWFGRKPLIDTPLKAVEITGELDCALDDLEASVKAYPGFLRETWGWPIRRRMRAIARLAHKRRLVASNQLAD